MSKIDIMKYNSNIEDIPLSFKRGHRRNAFNVSYPVNNSFSLHYFVQFVMFMTMITY